VKYEAQPGTDLRRVTLSPEELADLPETARQAILAPIGSRLVFPSREGKTISGEKTSPTMWDAPDGAGLSVTTEDGSVWVSPFIVLEVKPKPPARAYQPPRQA